MKKVRNTPILLLLALALVVWGCSNGGGSPTAPTAGATEQAIFEANCAKKPDHPSCPPPGDPQIFEMAIRYLVGNPDSSCSVSDCVPGMKFDNDDTIEVRASGGASNTPFVEDKAAAVTTLMTDDTPPPSCISDILDLYDHTDGLRVLKDRKGDMVVQWDFFSTYGRLAWWRLELRGEVAAGGETFPPPWSDPGDFLMLDITSATFEKGNGKGCSDEWTGNEPGVVRVERVF